MDKPHPYTIYMVRCADGTLYTGIAKDLTRRLAEHNRGEGAKYTAGRRPVRLVYREIAASRGLAQRREWEIKSMSRGQKSGLACSRARRRPSPRGKGK